MTRLRAPLLALLLLAGCASDEPTGPAPANPGEVDLDSGFYAGDAFVPGPAELSFTDPETGSRFNLVGQAYEGPLAADKVQLGLLPGMTAFWFAWSVHHPGARVWNNGINNEGVEIEGSDACAVPCREIRQGCGGGLDCIPSIDSPVWTTADDSPRLGYLVDSDRVLGLMVEGRARAYPLDTLWTHEIVNDTWGDWEFSLSYCPLTGSGTLVQGEQGGTAMRFGVSGNLYNSNLVMYDRETGTQYGQMRGVGFTGERIGEPLDVHGVIDTTWGAWRRMFPETGVLADDVGPASYPYGDYREDHGDTFITTNPTPDPKYPNKSYAIGVTVAGETVVYAFEEIEEQVGSIAIVQDEVGGAPVVVTFDSESQTAAVFSRRIGERVAEFTVSE